MPGQSVSTFAKFAINGTKLCFRQIIDESIYTIVDDSADTMCGSLDHDGRMVSAGIKIIRFRVIMRPSPQELSVLLPVMGLAGGPPNYALVANYASSKFTSVIDRVAKVATYTNCMVSRWILTGARGFRSLQLELHVVAEDITWAAAGTFTGTPPATRSAGYPLTTGTLTLEGATRRFNRFGLVCGVSPSIEWNNAVTADAIEAADRLISLSVSTPYTANPSGEIDLLDNAVSAPDGAAGRLLFASGSNSTQFDFPHLVLPATPPNVPQRSEIRFAQTYSAYIGTNGTAPPLAVTHSAA